MRLIFWFKFNEANAHIYDILVQPGTGHFGP